MSADNELKWLTKKFAWRYVPDRYQALVAVIVSAFLYLNVFTIFFEPVTTGSGACGTLLRPTFSDVNDPSWVWTTSPFSVDMDLVCPRHIYLSWWEFFASFIGLAICGLVLRRAIKREQAKPTS